MRPITIITLLALTFSSVFAADKTWTDPETATKEDPDFSHQGEYGSSEKGADFGVQVIALGDGKFHAYVLQDGLPGLGWTREKSRTLLEGTRAGEKITFISANKKLTSSIEGGQFIFTNTDGKKSSLPRIQRSSPTLEAKPPEGAIVLFDGSSAEQWDNGKIVNGNLLAAGCTSKEKFNGYTLHLEFRTPYKPTARGQKRGNSGIYHGGRWETQILDSFGLEGKDNECGGIYSVSKPSLNMCLPPLTWQTYDVELTAATFDTEGKLTTSPRITVKLNGLVIHDNLELKKSHTAAAPIKTPLSKANTKGPIFLQNHGNPVVFRNIWVVPK
jgi:hypothetical protein